MIEGFYGQHAGTGKWYAEIFHDEFGPITQWGDSAAEATRNVEIYVRRNWDPGVTEYSWAPYETPLMAGRLGLTKEQEEWAKTADKVGMEIRNDPGRLLSIVGELLEGQVEDAHKYERISPETAARAEDAMKCVAQASKTLSEIWPKLWEPQT